ncbi:hypothetical protein TREES_T100015851 [Tupaia chinensis]|uniref:Uncharacterized protein n=1 Tax=Tupaia chinensis TaxID=246437 RepID=L9L231_TUPCH|nr:hypothetical protein TREES_T100015851 [Tupaia chinensis]
MTQHKCRFLVHYHRTQLLHSPGDMHWLCSVPGIQYSSGQDGGSFWCHTEQAPKDATTKARRDADVRGIGAPNAATEPRKYSTRKLTLRSALLSNEKELSCSQSPGKENETNVNCQLPKPFEHCLKVPC